MFGYTKAALRVGVVVLVGLSAPVHAVEIPIKIPGCPERSGTDRLRSDPDSEGGRALNDESTCGGGGAGSESAYAYPGVRSPAAFGGGGGGGGGGGTSARSAAMQTPDSTGDVSQSTSGTGSGNTTPPVQTGGQTANVANSTTGSGGFGGGTSGGSSTSVGHVAPFPDLGGALSWLIAVIAAAFFWRRRIRV